MPHLLSSIYKQPRISTVLRFIIKHSRRNSNEQHTISISHPWQWGIIANNYEKLQQTISSINVKKSHCQWNSSTLTTLQVEGLRGRYVGSLFHRGKTIEKPVGRAAETRGSWRNDSKLSGRIECFFYGHESPAASKKSRVHHAARINTARCMCRRRHNCGRCISSPRDDFPFLPVTIAWHQWWHNCVHFYLSLVLFICPGGSWRYVDGSFTLRTRRARWVCRNKRLTRWLRSQRSSVVWKA